MNKYQCFSSLIIVNPLGPTSSLPYSQQPVVNYDHGFVLIKTIAEVQRGCVSSSSHTAKAGIRTQSHLVPKFTVFFLEHDILTEELHTLAAKNARENRMVL